MLSSSFIHPKNIDVYHVPDAVLGAGDTAVSKMDPTPCPHAAHISTSEQKDRRETKAISCRR